MNFNLDGDKNIIDAYMYQFDHNTFYVYKKVSIHVLTSVYKIFFRQFEYFQQQFQKTLIILKI